MTVRKLKAPSEDPLETRTRKVNPKAVEALPDRWRIMYGLGELGASVIISPDDARVLEASPMAETRAVESFIVLVVWRRTARECSNDAALGYGYCVFDCVYVHLEGEAEYSFGGLGPYYTYILE